MFKRQKTSQVKLIKFVYCLFGPFRLHLNRVPFLIIAIHHKIHLITLLNYITFNQNIHSFFVKHSGKEFQVGLHLYILSLQVAVSLNCTSPVNLSLNFNKHWHSNSSRGQACALFAAPKVKGAFCYTTKFQISHKPVIILA